MSDAYTPITTSRVLQTPRGHRIHTTTREVSDRFPLPVLGSELSASNFIAGFTDHIILDASEVPKPNGGKRVSVTHGTFPTGVFTEYESQAYTFPPIYPGSTFMPGGSRARQRVVPARVTYEYRAAIGDWMEAATLWDYLSPTTGPFEVKSYIAQAAGETFVAEDGSSGRVGDYLNPFYIGIDTVNDAINVYDPGDLFYTIGASAPSATTYAGWVANKTELMASRTVHKWYTGYMRRTAYVRAQ
jgi:hypothetical protein